MLIGLLLVSLTSFAQPVVVDAPKPALQAAPELPKSSDKSSWRALTPVQQQTLQPLAGKWDSLLDAQKRKWLDISKGYLSLSPEGQAIMHARMTEWVALSPKQRAQARLNFGQTTELSKALTSEEKNAKWDAYQLLSTEEKKKLAAAAVARKPAGAAPAARPVAPQKLAAVPIPASRSNGVSSPKPVNSPLPLSETRAPPSQIPTPIDQR